MHFLARYCQIEEITCLTQNIIPGLPPTESCESTRDGGGGRRLQFVPDSECVSVADVGVGCILASHSFAWFSVFFSVGAAVLQRCQEREENAVSSRLLFMSNVLK